ncbi:conserved hypothetical protein [Trichinella spiralis]|uniref:hypothetical protein n=1 Tax=Trichinella spiralis TaxID=6334 RepID=UPI0001EFC711|nr:conserved hypothetical protein [Trichinella spiralis]
MHSEAFSCLHWSKTTGKNRLQHFSTIYATYDQQQQQQNSTSIFAEFRSIRRDFEWQIHNASTKQPRYSMSKPTTRCQPPTLQGWQILSISLINCRMRWNPIEKSIPR